MPSAGELVRPIRSGLVPIPAQPQDGVCTTCHSSAGPGRTGCHQCEAASGLDPPEILPITLSVHGEVVHDHLRQYKDSPVAAVRERMAMRLGALVSLFVVHHGSCIGEWDSVTCVPSPRRVAMAPVVERVARFDGRYRQVLAAVRPELQGAAREPTAGRFEVTSAVTGERILLVDDTFVSGAQLFGAAAALRERGAVVVGPLVVGRHVRRDWPPTRSLLSWIEERRWDEARCARCAGERRHARPDA